MAETTYRAFGKEELRLVVRRVKPAPGSRLALSEAYEYHAFIVRHEALLVRVGGMNCPPVYRSRPVKLRAA